jgi:hypothetical protein
MNLKLWLDTVTTVFIVVGGFLALLQLRQTHKHRSRESALQMLHSFQTPEFLTAVNIIFDLPEGLSKEDLEQRLGDKSDVFAGNDGHVREPRNPRVSLRHRHCTC